MEDVNPRQRLLFFGFLALVLIGGIFVLFIGFSHKKASRQQSSLNDQATQSVDTSYGIILPNGGVNVEDVTYFDNKQWVVANLVPKEGVTDASTIVAQKQSDGYHIKVGPGTLFGTDQLQGVPDDVVQYLSDQGLLYIPDNNSD
ncbi:MAG TPA: hypothetical protein VLG27_04910 [Candidatus Saccharimonadia bacterium]|nr:hypothetical protein [Candidatus Saccharimonadia bacterium]